MCAKKCGRETENHNGLGGNNNKVTKCKIEMRNAMRNILVRAPLPLPLSLVWANPLPQRSYFRIQISVSVLRIRCAVPGVFLLIDHRIVERAEQH